MGYGVVGQRRRAEKAAAHEDRGGFRDVLGKFAEREVRLAACGAVDSVATFHLQVLVEMALFSLVAGLACSIAGGFPLGDGIALFVDDDGADGARGTGEFAEEDEAFAAVGMLADIENLGVVGNFANGVAGREFRHAALVVLRDVEDFGKGG